MKAWKSPPQHEDHDTAPLFAKMARVEGLALRVVEDEVGDAGFGLLSLIVGWMAVLQRRIGVAERWNRRAARKKAMLSSEALRMNMCDRLGGVGALERWEERARERFVTEVRRDGSRSRINRDTVFRESGKGAVGRKDLKMREFALPRMPGRGVRKVTTRIVRAAPKHEMPIPVWPCEVLPERFDREWWREAAPGAHSRPDMTTDAFPEGAASDYAGARDGEHDRYGARARDPAAAQRDTSPGMRISGEPGYDDGGPGSRPGAMVCAPIV